MRNTSRRRRSRMWREFDRITLENAVNMLLAKMQRRSNKMSDSFSKSESKVILAKVSEEF